MKNIRDLYRGISDFKKGYRTITNIVEDKKGDLVTNSYSILVRWRNHYLQLLNAHGVNDVKQTEIHTAEPLVSEPSECEFEFATEKLKRHKSPGIDQILAIINSNWNKQELPREWKESNNVSIYKKGDKAECSNYRGKSFLSTTYKILCNIF